MKISPKSIKKELEEKQLAEKEVERKIRFKETLQKSRFSSLMTRCLEAAVAGNKEVDLGYEFYDLKDIEEQILDKWIDIVYLSKNDYLIKKISDKLKLLKLDHVKAIHDLNVRKLESII
jgi:predicted polyphosphate/ATP-dependent NAD kinase